MTEQQQLAALYDSLARFEWRRRRRRDGLPELAVRKRLAPAADGNGPVDSGHALDDWLWQQMVLPREPRVLDVGAGFGGTVLRWAESHSGTFVGLMLSEFEVARAREQAADRGLSERVCFRSQSFDNDIDGSFDAVVAVETLFHAHDLAHTLQHLAGHLAPGGTLVMLEDLAVGPQVADEPAARELARRWRCSPLRSVDDMVNALAAAGLHVVKRTDLTSQCRASGEQRRRRSRRRLELLRRLLPRQRTRLLVDAFLGGLALEELYDRGQMRYQVLVTRSEAAR